MKWNDWVINFEYQYQVDIDDNRKYIMIKYEMTNILKNGLKYILGIFFRHRKFLGIVEQEISRK